MSKLRRIVCYAVNGAGMGHITRLLSIARWLRRYVSLLEGKPPEILFLTSSEATGVLLDAGFASFKLPSKTVVRQAGMDMLEYRRLARHFVWHTLGTFQPDLLLVDTFPAGSFDELLQLLDAPFQRALILRRVKPDFAARPVFQAALRLYPTLVIPHADGDLADFGLPPNRPHHFCGEVLQLEPADLLPPAQARALLGVPDDRRLIYLSAGGGGDPNSHQDLSALVQALQPDPSLHLLVGAGPLYQGPRMGGDRLTWLTEPGVARYFAACDAAISAAGYNTFHELLLARVPSLFFAQPKVADDQALRIHDAQRRGACLLLRDPLDHDATRAALRDALRDADSLRKNCADLLPDNGAARCAQRILTTSYDAEALAWAASLATDPVARAFEAHGADGVQTMARWLPTILPQGQLRPLEHRPAFQALLAQLSPAAAAEVNAALEHDPQAHELAALQRALASLVQRSAHWPGGVEQLASLVDAAARKHPLQQEQHRRWLPWMTDLLDGLSQILSEAPADLDPNEIAQIYRVFPRLVDADLAQSLDAFRDLLTRAQQRGDAAHQLQQALRTLKFAHRRVTRDAVASLLTPESAS